MEQVLPEGREAPILLVAPANLDAKITGVHVRSRGHTVPSCASALQINVQIGKYLAMM